MSTAELAAPAPSGGWPDGDREYTLCQARADLATVGIQPLPSHHVKGVGVRLHPVAEDARRVQLVPVVGPREGFPPQVTDGWWFWPTWRECLKGLAAGGWTLLVEDEHGALLEAPRPGARRELVLAEESGFVWAPPVAWLYRMETDTDGRGLGVQTEEYGPTLLAVLERLARSRNRLGGNRLEVERGVIDVVPAGQDAPSVRYVPITGRFLGGEGWEERVAATLLPLGTPWKPGVRDGWQIIPAAGSPYVARVEWETADLLPPPAGWKRQRAEEFARALSWAGFWVTLPDGEDVVRLAPGPRMALPGAPRYQVCTGPTVGPAWLVQDIRTGVALASGDEWERLEARARAANAEEEERLVELLPSVTRY